MILAERAARMAAEAKAAEASAVRQGLTLEVERLKLEIARLRRERFGPSAERSARLEQLELSLEDLEKPPLRRKRPKRLMPARRPKWVGLPVASRPAVRFPSTCRVGAWSIQPPPLARAVAGLCASWARS